MFRGLPLRRSLLKVAVMGLILVLASVIAVLSRGSDRAAAATFGPVAEYSFDEDPGEGTTIEDLSGDGHTATIHGAKWTLHGRYGGAMEFNEHEETYLSVPDSPELDLTEEFTLEAWVRPEEGRRWQPIVDKQIGGGEGEERDAWWLYAAGPDPQRPWGGTEHAAGGGHEVAAPEPLAPEVWSHVALTFDGAVERLYVDGVLVDSGPAEAPLETGGEVEIGGATETGDFLFGRLDEVRIYDRVLGQPAVAADMETPIQTPKKAPVAEYSFDEGEEAGATVEDLAGENDGTIEGAERITHGRYGGAMEFGGEPDCVTVPDSASLQLGEEFTVEAWVRPDALFHGPIISKAAELTPSYELAIGSTGNGLVQGWAGGYDEYAETEVHSAQKLEPHVWTHLALTYDGAYLRLYVDGQLAGSSTHAEFVLESGGPLTIGCSTVEGQWFEGRIDEVRLYERALGEGEVAADMEAPIQTPKAGPLAAYSFDEGEIGTEGGTVEDVSEHEHTATLEGGAGWAKGRYGGALNIPDEGCATVPASPELDVSEEFTVEAWVRPEGGIYEDPVVVKEAGGDDAFGIGIGSREEWYAEGFIGEGKGSKAAIGGEKIRPYEWVHLAATWDGAEIRLYVDGELVSTEAATTPPLTGEGSLRIGCDGADGPFGGRIDEVRLYARTLNGPEIDSDMESPLRTPKATPVAEYSFDEKNEESAADITGDGHTATVEGAKWTEHGKYGGAYEFKASEDDVLKIPASEELDFDEEFTLEAWVRPSGEDNHHAPLIDKQEGSGHGYFLYEGGTVSDRPYGAADEEGEFVHAEEPLPADTWSHVALVFSGNRTYLYVDGELVDNGAAEPTVTSEGELEIGGSSDTGEYFDGRIDEVRIYNRELDQAEIDADMEAPIQTPKRGPIAAWSFDEGLEAGPTVEDITGDEHEGTIEGATRTENGRFGGALEFSGEESCVSVPDSESLQLAEGFTLEAWVKSSGSPTADPILFKESEGIYSYAMGIGFEHYGKPQGFADGEELRGSEGIEPGVWTHLAFTYDGSTLRLYVNGEEVESEPVGMLDLQSKGPLYIGCDGPAYGDHFRGRIDEVRIYDRALDDSEVLNDMGPHDSMVVATAEHEGTITRAVGRITYSTSGGQRQRSVPHFSLSVSYLGPIPHHPATATRLSGGDDVRDVEERPYLFKECPYGPGPEIPHTDPDPGGGGKAERKFTEDVANEGEIRRGCPLVGGLGGKVMYTIEILGDIRYDSGVIVESEIGPTCVTRGNPVHEENEEKLRMEIKEEPTKGKEQELKELELTNAKPELAKDGCFATPPGGGTKSSHGIDMIGRWHWKPASDCDCLGGAPFQETQFEPQACGEQDGHIGIYPIKESVEETITRQEHFYVFESSPTAKHVQGCDWNHKNEKPYYHDADKQ
jgi:hypothetical protein